MECINCNTKNSLKERKENDGRCKKCEHQFVFEPAEMKSGVRITDDLFKEVIAEVSANHTLFFTPVQLYYSLDQKLRSNPDRDNPLIGYICGGGLILGVIIWIFDWLKFRLDLIAPILFGLYSLVAIILIYQSANSSENNRQVRRDNANILSILSVVIFVFGIPLSIIAKTPIGIIGSISLGILAAWLSFGLKQLQSKIFSGLLIDRKDFLIWLNRWISINYRPGKILSSPKISTVQATSVPNVIAYDFDRVVVCDSPKIAQLLLKNNFHFENNCAVMAIDRYPQHIFIPMKKMLDRIPNLKVYAVHDCSPQGLRMIRHLRSEQIWFPDLKIPIIDVGILPRQIRDNTDAIISQSAESAQFAKQLSPYLRNSLDPTELAWLDAGFYLELESFSPQKLIQILQRAISESHQLAEIEAGDLLVMDSPGFYTIESFG
jgi:hypothetical protein